MSDKLIANNDLHPVTPFDHAYAQLILDIIYIYMIERKPSPWRLERHLEWLLYRQDAGDAKLNDALSEIKYYVGRITELNSYKYEENTLLERISRMQEGETKEAFLMMASFARARKKELLGPLMNLAENFDSESIAFTDDCSEPEHSVLQSITRECGELDSYHSAEIHRAISHCWGAVSKTLHQKLLTIAKALPRYRGHARV